MVDVDLGAVREDQVAAFSEDEILDLDEEFPLRSELVARLGALPHRAFFGCIAACLADIRAAYGEGLSGEGLDLVERSLATVQAAADGQPVKDKAAELWADWCKYMKFDPDADDDAEPVPTDVVNDLQGPCAVVAWALADAGRRYEAAEAIARSAESYVDWDAAGANVRLLLRFIARANEARANHTPAG
jgi:hypothetical protein